MKNKITELMDELDELTELRDVVMTITDCKDYLTSLTPEELTGNQKLWLLAFQASEAKLAQSGVEQAQNSKDEFLGSMAILKEAIVTGLLLDGEGETEITFLPTHKPKK